MPRVLRSVIAVAALLLSLLLVPATVRAAPAAPPTLTGEAFTITGSDYGAACNTTGSFTFTTSGTAQGPYAGTFTATGTATIGPEYGSIVSAFTATFAIHSPTGEVTGTLVLPAPFRTTYPSRYSCYETADTALVYRLPVAYTATIHTPSGIYQDAGTSDVDVAVYHGVTGNFYEVFTSTQVAPTPVATTPTSKEQCKDGGYARFIDPATGQPFKNQGRCIQFVNTGK